MPFKLGNKSISKVYKGINEITKGYLGTSLVYEVSSGNQTTARGESVYTTPGTYSWTCPENVYDVSVVAIGSGGGTSSIPNGVAGARAGGGGAGLGYKNSIPVVPGQSYTVVVGAAVLGDTGNDSYFIDVTTVKGGKGSVGGTPGTFVGDGGGNGGSGGSSNNVYTDARAGGGGGAGGYAGAGGNGGTTSSGGHGSSGGGGGGAGRTISASGGGSGYFGGGTGIFGQGSNGTAAASRNGYAGSGGDTTSINTTPDTRLYGAGALGQRKYQTAGGWPGIAGGAGAVRIVWGSGRAFPSTNVGQTT